MEGSKLIFLSLYKGTGAVILTFLKLHLPPTRLALLGYCAKTDVCF